MEFDQNLDKITESLLALRDHFESKGQRFFIAYYIYDENVGGTVCDLITTSADRKDYGDAIMQWAGIADEYSSSQENDEAE